MENIESCPKCSNRNLEKIEIVPSPTDILKNEEEQTWLYGFHCKLCHKCTHILVPNDFILEEETFQEIMVPDDPGGVSPLTIDSLLKTDQEGWIVADTKLHRFQQAVLCNAVYILEEGPDRAQLEAEFALPYSKDQVWLCCADNFVLGFAVIKLKGERMCSSSLFARNPITTLDAIYVRKSHRRRGLVKAFLQILFNTYEGCIGFSEPVSVNLMLLLRKLLHEDQDGCRDRLFYYTPDCNETDIRSIWISENRKTEEHKETPTSR